MVIAAPELTAIAGVPLIVNDVELKVPLVLEQVPPATPLFDHDVTDELGV
jgi:hypothetical protein